MIENLKKHPFKKVCKKCGEAFQPNTWWSFYCDKCRKIIKQNNGKKRKKNAKDKQMRNMQ